MAPVDARSGKMRIIFPIACIKTMRCLVLCKAEQMPFGFAKHLFNAFKASLRHLGKQFKIVMMRA